MLKRLKLKFILINMTIVTLMLCAIFGLMYYSTGGSMERESVQMLKNLAESPAKPEPPYEPKNEVRLPYFSVLTDRNGNVLEADGGFFDLSDKEQLNAILALTTGIKAESGVLKEYKLRFFRSETPMGTRIVFADMSSEQATMKNLARTFVIIGVAAFLLFLAISYFMARWAVKPVEDAWKQQKQFVADASHELKTPLTVIITDAELLSAPDCPETDRGKLTGGILAMSSQMRGLVENLLDLARMDNGSVKEDFGPASLSEIVSDAAMLFEPAFFEKGLPMRYETGEDIRIIGIASHLKQLIGILLDNAGKYASPGGEIIVKLSRCGHKRCLLEVSDQGEPLGREELQNIFKRFYRGDKARSMNRSYGLGLSIAQSIAEEHQGKIWADSKDGYNRFFVELPCKE